MSIEDDNEDDVKILIINPETDLPYDDDDPIVITKAEFRSYKEAAEARGMTFEEYFTHVIQLALDNLKSNPDFPVANFGLRESE